MIPLKKAKTDANGVAHFEKLVKLPAYTIYIRYGASEIKVDAKPNEIVDVKLNMIQISSPQTYLKYIIAAVIIAVAIGISIRLISYVRSAL